MILNTGSRTDIPAFYSRWFYNRIKEGWVLVRNPYHPIQITRYILSPRVIDAVIFCTKNPEPMLEGISALSAFDTFWFVTITPYGKDIEPFVPEKEMVIESFQKLSDITGCERMSWRYDPVFISETYTSDYHIRQFEKTAVMLKGYTKQCVVSFIDLYEKTKRNFPEAKNVTGSEQRYLIEAFGEIAEHNDLQIHLCCESSSLVRNRVDADGCMSKGVLERALGCRLNVPKKKMARSGCECLLGADIGAYHTCGHGCLYCYANYDRQTVEENMKQHDENSPLLIGHTGRDDQIKDAEQKTWKDEQINLFDLM